MTQRPRIARRQLPTFDWSKIDIESFRGPGLSFPLEIELVVAPSFGERVIGAMASFRKYYGGYQLLDPEEDGFQTRIESSIWNTANNRKEALETNDLAIRMRFICDYQRVVIIALGTEEDLTVFH